MSGSDESSTRGEDVVQEANEVQAVEHHDIDEDEGELDEHHVSLAARSLQILAILVVGGALALWAGPRLAPNLPSGMGAVARWLTPGASLAEAQVAELRSTFEARLAAQAPQIDAGAIDARIAASPNLAGMAAEIAALNEKLSALETLPADLDDRIALVESRLEAAEAMEARLETQLRDLVTAGMAGDSQAAADITAYGATIEALRSRIADLDEQLAAQAARMDAITAEIRNEAETAIADATAARASSELQAALIALEAALADGLPYAGTLEWLNAMQGAEIPAELAAQAASGVTSTAELLDSFPSLAHEAIRIDIRRTGAETTLGQFGAFLESQVASRSLTPQQGDSVDAILSRAEAALRADDLAAAIGEMQSLPAHAQAVFAGWMEAAAQRQAVLADYSTLKSTLLEGAQ
ncbi:mitofilin family membrane protein [Abyssibius alkaniclasticus]|uniref:COG4223 family protein n=1 Tax=Abyssibius alkaniclasticus TaxID=2881234 RepID=UPI0023641478|nr:mitofilin family membrane protein [Abyssibius alkaniclasticus]UPH72042.1 mitofilin family membrane protein [Abyssibius alkaniclasticus]